MKTISSRHNPLVARFRAAARGEAPDLVLLDGVHLVTEAINAGVHVREVAITSEAAHRPAIHHAVSRLVRSHTKVFNVSAPVMDALSPLRSPGRIVAIADRPDRAADQLYRGPSPLVVIAVDVQDPGNVGAMVRVAEAGGASGFMAAGACADPLGWKALRGSMGSGLRLPIVVQRDASLSIEDARRHGCRIVAAVPHDGRSAFEMDYAGPLAILIGGEGPGLPASLAATADERVTVPMQAPVESLNAAVTAALLVYEVRRQRTPSEKPVFDASATNGDVSSQLP
jgi:RNA methyltransferase, TrmH family